MMAEDGIRLTEEEQKRRQEQQAVPWDIGAIVVLFFWVTIAKLGANVFKRPL